MYNAIINATKAHIVTNSDFDFVIPAGTAIQNLRTSFIGDTLTRDGYHMSYELGRYATALTWVYKLFEDMEMGVPNNVTYTPDSWKVPVTYLPAIHESVANAIKTPLAVTNSSYTTAASMLNSNDYVLLDWQPVCNGYWNSTDTNSYVVITTTASNSPYFIASGARFTREDIPLGSVIVLESGYQYRAEGWANLGQINPYARPENVQTKEIIVNEAWWGSFNYRGFNLSKQSGSISGTTAEQAKNILKIYVPANKVTGANKIESFKLMGKECTIGESTVSLTVVEGTDVTNLVPTIKVSDGATITPLAGVARDFSRPVHYKVKNKAGHTKIYTVSISYKKAIDLSMYNVLNWEPKLNSYWHSGAAATQSLSSDSKYIASRLFSKSEIPVGSIIEVDAGYQYRPEAWTDMTNATSGRPGVVSKAQVIVDEAWWGKYNYRAFNISSISGVSLSGNENAAISAFRIYVPKNLVEVFGMVIDSPSDGMVSVVWGNPGNNQLFNVYIDGELAVSDSGLTLSNVACASYMIPTTEGIHTIKVTTTYGGIETPGVTGTVTVVGNGIEETTTRYINGGIEINGCQISTTAEGMRLIYSVESEIEGKEVVASGVMYSLVDWAKSDELCVGSQDYYVADFESTQKGICNKLYSESDSATSYAMTMRFVYKTASEFNANWKARAYAKLSDGSYVYSDSVDYSIYEVADVLYQNNSMAIKEGHEYLHTNILVKVNKDYIVKEYNYFNTYINN